MRRSLNEIEVGLRKAAMGAGYGYGTAEDLGQAGAWLCAHGFDGVAACAIALRGRPQGPPNPEPNGTGYVFPHARVAECGPSALDRVFAGGGDGVRLGDVDAPLLLTGLAGAVAEIWSTGIVLRFDNGCTIQVGPHGAGMTGELPPAGTDVAIALTAPCGAASGAAPAPDGVDVDEDAWDEVQTLAARTCVPASGASRATGAGAGDIDND